MQDALASNSGDRYHFVYAARRMLDMLYPRNDLKLIVMEGVTKEDERLSNDPETFQGVDLTEYYGGKTSEDAKKIIIVQVKYSPTNPNSTWTLNRLCKNKYSKNGNPKPGTSVIGKLAKAFNVFYEKLSVETLRKIKIKLYSNQQLKSGISKQLTGIQEIVRETGISKYEEFLKSSTEEQKKIIDRLKEATELSWTALSSFLACWDLSGFGQSMLSVVESELFSISSAFHSDSQGLGEKLISFVSDHAGKNRRTEIIESFVYNQLRVREIDFFPAPTDFPIPEKPIFTKTAEDLLKKTESMAKGILHVHGISGTGKSTLIQLLSQRYAEGKSTIVYDCFAGGKGFSPGNERFPYKTCFVQIVNELDGLFHTNILATSRLEYKHLMQQFNKALAKASTLADEQGNKLIIAIDAIDNAVEGANRAHVKSSESFVPILWDIEIPANCIIIVSSRTENIDGLNIVCEKQDFEIEGFTQKETADYIRHYWEDADANLLDHIYKRTKGNPRVQAKLMEEAILKPPKDRYNFVSERAKESAIKYYKAECPKHLRKIDDKTLLEILLEVTLPVKLPVLAEITQRPGEEIRKIIRSLYFGLRLSEPGEVEWIDQDFWDFSKGYVKGEIETARIKIAEYCRDNFGQRDYATHNLSRHFYAAGQYKELLDWWISDNRLESRIADVSPHEEDVLADVKYGILSAQKTGQFAGALKLLALSADILQGRDVFCSVIKDHPEIAIKCNYLERLLNYLREKEDGQEVVNVASHYLSIARILAESRQQPERVEELISRGIILLKQEAGKNKGEGIFYDNNIYDLALIDAITDGFETALEKMQSWSPQENIYSIYAFLTKEYAAKGKGGEETIRTIEKVDLSEYQRAYSLLGVISSADVVLKKEILIDYADKVLTYIREKVIDYTNVRDMIPKLIENLLSKSAIETAKLFMPYWQEPEISDRGHIKEIKEFLHKKAIETISGIHNFDPKGFKPVHLKDDDRGYNYELELIREIMEKQFPSALVRGRALMGIPPERIIEEIQDCLSLWRDKNDYPRTEIVISYIDTACNLLEAVINLKDSQHDLVKRICDTTELVFSDLSMINYYQFAEILSHDQRYYALVEKMVDFHRKEIKEQEYNAKEKVDLLLSLYSIASRFDQNLAKTLFSEARQAACEWEGNVDGRALALINTIKRAEKESKFRYGHMQKLSMVFRQLKKLSFYGSNILLDEALRFMSRINPAFSLAYLKDLNQSGIISFDEGIGAVGLGMLDVKKVPPLTIWPLTHVLYPFTVKDKQNRSLEIFYETASQALSNGEEIERLLHRFSKYIRTDVMLHLRAEEAQRLCAWAGENGLDDNREIKSLNRYTNFLRKWRVGEDDAYLHKVSKEVQQKQEEISPLFSDFSINLNRSPQAALDCLRLASSESLKELTRDELYKIIDQLLETLPSSQLTGLIAFIDECSTKIYLSLLGIIDIVKKILNKQYIAEETGKLLSELLKRLLTPDKLRSLSHYSKQEHMDIILDSTRMNIQTKFDIFLSVIFKYLKELDSDTIYLVIGHLSGLLEPSQAFGVFEMLLEKDFEKVPGGAAVTIEKDHKPLPALVKFLSDYCIASVGIGNFLNKC